jgi:chaperonin GroES
MELAEDLILVLPDKTEEKTSSGIYLPDTVKKKENRGTVVLVGPGTSDEPMNVKVGEYILFKPHAGIEEEYNGETHLIMKQDDKLAKLR